MCIILFRVVSVMELKHVNLNRKKQTLEMDTQEDNDPVPKVCSLPVTITFLNICLLRKLLMSEKK